MEIFLFSIGKMQDQHYAALEQKYAKRLRFPWKLSIHYYKNESQLEAACRNQQGYLIILDEKGSEMTSVGFAQFLDRTQQVHQRITVVIGDTDGIPSKIAQVAHSSIALSLYTFPHELARVIFLEQLYRAQTILLQHPYHRSS